MTLPVAKNSLFAHLFDLSTQALWAFNDNRLRTFLSVIGVAIGISAVVVIATISTGGRIKIFAELETFGLRTIWVSRERTSVDPNKTVAPGTGIDNTDLNQIKHGLCCNLVRKLSPIVKLSGRPPIIRVGQNYSNADLLGVNQDYLAINNDDLDQGRMLNVRDIQRHRYVAIIGVEILKELFPNASVLGKEITISGHSFKVVGILRKKSRDFLASIGSAGGQDANTRILIPYTRYQQMLGMKDQVTYLQAEATEVKAAQGAVSQLIDFLKKRHKGRYQYKGSTMSQYIHTANKILQGVSLIGIVAASVSLLVGGLGIMNIMSTSVIERTREIGLRKAAGATEWEIRYQFIFEAIVISLTGGLIGLVMGVIASTVVSVVIGFPITTSWIVVLIGTFISISVGFLSGYIPAGKAARKEPATALRYE